MTSKKFKPLMVSFNERAFEEAKVLGEKKLALLKKGIDWISPHMSVKPLGVKKIHQNMVGAFKEAILIVYMEQNQLGLSADKLIEVKEIPIHEFHTIQEEYEKLKVEVTFKNHKPTIELSRRDFETWTTNEKQNKRVIAGNKFISDIKELQEYCHVYPRHIITATSGFINYDLGKSRYLLNPEIVFP